MAHWAFAVFSRALDPQVGVGCRCQLDKDWSPWGTVNPDSRNNGKRRMVSATFSCPSSSLGALVAFITSLVPGSRTLLSGLVSGAVCSARQWFPHHCAVARFLKSCLGGCAGNRLSESLPRALCSPLGPQRRRLLRRGAHRSAAQRHGECPKPLTSLKKGRWKRSGESGAPWRAIYLG